MDGGASVATGWKILSEIIDATNAVWRLKIVPVAWMMDSGVVIEVLMMGAEPVVLRAVLIVPTVFGVCVLSGGRICAVPDTPDIVRTETLAATVDVGSGVFRIAIFATVHEQSLVVLNTDVIVVVVLVVTYRMTVDWLPTDRLGRCLLSMASTVSAHRAVVSIIDPFILTPPSCAKPGTDRQRRHSKQNARGIMIQY